MGFQDTFMNALKARYIETVGVREFGGTASKMQSPYYLKHLEDNLITPMSDQHVSEYGEGNGSELDGKMKALRSSSAMTFNLFGNGPVQLNGAYGLPAGTYTVEYEHQLPTLKGNPHPANLDAKLEDADVGAVIYCEMKLAEWILNKAGGLHTQYLESGSYLIPDTQAAVFREAFASLCDDLEATNGKLPPKLTRYDAFQMLKHLLAIYTESHRRAEAEETLPNRTFLLNCVWEMDNPEKLGKYAAKYRSMETEEHDQFALFKSALTPVSKMFSALGTELSVCYLPLSCLLECIELEASHRKALERYIV